MLTHFFDRISIIDFEFIVNPGERPLPVCLVFYEIVSGETKRIWLEGKDPLSINYPYSMEEKDLFVAYYSSAEWGCHLALNWPLPINVIDLYPEYRRLTNGIPGISKGLLGACKIFGINAIAEAEKEQARDRILQGAPYSEDEKEFIMKYCESDVLETAELFKKIVSLNDFYLPTALFRGKYMEAIALMEHNGIPIDIETLTSFKENWPEIQGRLIREIDQDYGIYEGTTFKINKFEQYLISNNISWVRTEKGNLELNDETFKQMVVSYPQLQGLKDLRDILGKLRLSEIPVGSDGRNRCLLSPFSTKTGRNAPSTSKFIFGPAVWMRSLIKPDKGKVLAYVDYSQQEFFIAAVHSNDSEMKAAYESGDPYIAFAKQAGAVPQDATKVTHKTVRDLYKACVLGVQYGMGKESLALRIAKSNSYAKELLQHHNRVFKTYWSWCDHVLNSALLLKRIDTCFGWQLHVFGQDKKEMRTINNFPSQATGAEILRVACILLMENDIKILAPVHDAMLIECDEEKAEASIKLTQKLMSDASEIVLGVGNRIKTEADVIKYPDRYSDPRGVETWNKVLRIVEEIKAGNCDA